jgi:hypothetical protein
MRAVLEGMSVEVPYIKEKAGSIPPAFSNLATGPFLKS